MSEPPQIPTSKTGQVVQALRRAERIAVFTGAGVSADSGLPTYRGVGGLYNDMTVDEGLPIEEVLSGAMFARSPEITWKYIAEIERACRGATANDAHRAILALEEYAEVWVITQNVDGFHVDAGSSNVIELHGNLSDLFCTQCGARFRVHDYAAISIPPRCEQCRGLMRPSVVLFGEMLPDAAIAQYDKIFESRFDLIFAIGTTAGFPYIYEPVANASRQGVPTVEINPDQTPLSTVVTHRFNTGAGTALKDILNAI
jgi:NAD-dependent deacetylase